MAPEDRRATSRRCCEIDALLEKHKGDWFVRETIGFLRRTLSRLDVSSRSHLRRRSSRARCFAGTLLELALAADRSYMLDVATRTAPQIALRALNFGTYPMANGSPAPPRALLRRGARRCSLAKNCSTAEARELGLVTFAPDDIDWEDEVRIAIEERASLSPDALTGMEASLRFAGPETMETQDLRPPVRLAELDLPPPERRRRAGRAEGLRHRAQAPNSTGSESE